MANEKDPRGYLESREDATHKAQPSNIMANKYCEPIPVSELCPVDYIYKKEKGVE
jgi:hypothetical protein